MIPRPLHDVFGVPALLLPTAVAAAAVLLAALLLARRSARRRDALVSPSLAARLGLPAHGVSWPAAALAALAVLGTGLALSRPRWGAETESARRMGTDVVLILDTSGSMRATDVSPARFVLARQAASSLVERLGGDRIALVACEGEAQVLVPLTLDLAAVGLFLDALEPGVGTKPGTSLAAGLAAAEELFPAGASGSKQCVFVSDGEDLEGGVEEALEAARKEGMVVHTVFVGSPAGSGAPVPEVDVAGRATGYKTDEKGAPVLSRPNPGLLRQVAARTGGSYSVISPGRTDLFGVAREIDRAARKPLSQELLTSRPERFQIPLGVAVACVGLLLLGGAPGRLRPLPSRRGGAAALLAGLLLAAAAAPAQQPPATPPGTPPGAAPAAPPQGAGEPAAVPTPSPLPLWERLVGSPRAEAKKGAKALEEKKPDEALARFDRQRALAPGDAAGTYNLGSALLAAGRLPEAVAALDEARRSGSRPLSRDAAYNEGKAFFAGKSYEKAAAAFRQALKLSPGDADAAWNYELSLRHAEDERKKKQQQQQKKDGPSPSPSPSPQSEKEQKEREDKEFEEKARMSREKAEQLLSAINSADLDEQKRRLAERRKERRVARDW